MQMDIGLDTGAMRLIGRTPVADKTAGALTDELAAMGAALMARVLTPTLPPLRHRSAARGRRDVRGEDRQERSAARLPDRRGAGRAASARVQPRAGRVFELDGERYKILAAEVVHPAETVAGAAPGITLDDALTIACNPGAIRATRVQRAGKPAMDAGEFLRGRAIPKGTRLA